MITYLPWDSDFFGFKTGKATEEAVAGMNLQQIQQMVQDQKYRLVYFVGKDLQPDSSESTREFHRLMHLAGAFAADRKVVYHRVPPQTAPENTPSKALLQHHGPVTEKLLQLALQAGQYSRFNIDPRFPHHLFVRMYTEWIRKSVSGELADEVLVVHGDKDTIRGFVTIKHHHDHSVIGLIAVDAASRGQQVGSLLMKAAEASCVRAGNNRLEVATQKDNKPACRFYEKAGFTCRKVEAIYHWWE